MSTSLSTQYGTATVSEKFSGNDSTKYPTWKAKVEGLLLTAGIKLPEDRVLPWYDHNEHAYATTAAEHVPILVLTANQQSAGYAVGDLALKPENRRLSEEDKEKKLQKRNMAISRVRGWVLNASSAYARIKPGMDAKDFRTMWFDLDDYYDAKDMATLMAHSLKATKFQKTNGLKKPMEIFDSFNQLVLDFDTVAGVATQPDGMTEIDFLKKQVKMFQVDPLSLSNF